MPPSYRAESLVDSLRKAEAATGRKRPRVLFPCGTRARRETSEGLRAGGFDVQEMVVYETLALAPAARAREQLSRGVDVILFHSPSAVESFAEQGLTPFGALVACIGPTTAEAARRAGLGRLLIAEEHSDEGLLRSVERVLRGARCPVLAIPA